MIHANNYKTVFTFVKVMQKKTVASFFPDTVYNHTIYIHTKHDCFGATFNATESRL